mmetsp:Transcript_32514/g.67811  ORF Transcript_32514/g.67811 Transcript_32514/m.67811 type:complete len:324 (-) Transcript_32514:1438-2409(-)|eukprot:CAMPEP_0172463944 /NCGR_PEP_ID=MMETSP1065-20121228/48837_1 /TAXON_ID=265537 /ORGANISM="Amphiprora paludosa, Strain CCMP125" /LENGTH=323 /DNA_ID=CAMNT_0013220031 /DNA_START=108 /DNA_END=1079 /DNA_ORIENTATION=+
MAEAPTKNTKKQTVYFVRHAEAAHNILERHAVESAIARGILEKEEQERCRRAVLNDESLKDAPLSQNGILESRRGSRDLTVLNSMGGSKYRRPTLVLVSPLRRALMTATELFLTSKEHGTTSAIVNEDESAHPSPKFVALESLREKRTGFAADERRSVDELEQEFPHVDFSDLRDTSRAPIPIGEDNQTVRARGRAFLEDKLANEVSDEAVALVTHKGWLRELRKTLRSYVDQGQLHVDFDLDEWDQTLYKNAEVRVAEFGWEAQDGDDDEYPQFTLTSIVSRSVENAMSSVVENAVKHLIAQSLRSLTDSQTAASRVSLRPA